MGSHESTLTPGQAEQRAVAAGVPSPEDPFAGKKKRKKGGRTLLTTTVPIKRLIVKVHTEGTKQRPVRSASGLRRYCYWDGGTSVPCFIQLVANISQFGLVVCKPG